MKQVTSILVVLIAFNCIQLNGQSIKDTVHIKEVSVLAKKKPQELGINLTKPDSIAMKKSQTMDISELVSTYTPIFIKSYGQGATATASFRGTGASHTQVAWNGMNLNSPMRGAVDLSQLPVFFIEEATIYHGGSSMQQGSGGLGGSISLQNKPDWNSNLSFSGIINKASFLTNKYFVNIKYGNNQLISSSRLFYEGSENNFAFYNYGVIPNKPDVQKSAEYWKSGGLQEFYFRTSSDQIFTLRFWLQCGERELPPLMSYEGEEREETQNDHTIKSQFSWKNYKSPWNPEFFSGLNYTKLDYFRNSPDFGFVIADSRSSENSYFNKFSLQHAFTNGLLLSMAANLNYHKVKTLNRVDLSGYEEDRLEGSLLFNLHLKTKNNFAAAFLIRPEFYDNNFVFLTPMLGMEWTPNKASKFLFQTNIARNFHKPNLNDLYWLPGGNPDLKPEDGVTGDMSVSFHKNNQNLELASKISGFMSKINNWILWQPAKNGAYYWEADNVKEVFSRGLEYQGNLTAKVGEVLMKIHGNYAFTRSSNLNAKNSVDQSRGKQLIYIPKHSGNFFFNLDAKGYSLRYGINYTGKRYTTSSNQQSDYEQVLTSYWLHSVSLEKVFKKNESELSIKAKINNLLDTNYQGILWRAMPGRNYSLTLAFKIGS